MANITVNELFNLFMQNPDMARQVITDNGKYNVEVYFSEYSKKLIRLFIVNNRNSCDKWQCVYTLENRLNARIDWWESDSLRINPGIQGLIVELS